MNPDEDGKNKCFLQKRRQGIHLKILLVNKSEKETEGMKNRLPEERSQSNESWHFIGKDMREESSPYKTGINTDIQ